MMAMKDCKSEDYIYNARGSKKPAAHWYVCPILPHTNPHIVRYMIGSTMGSHQDLIDATNFIAEHKVVPIVSHVLDDLESADQGFGLMEKGEQFGKIVIRVRHDEKVASRL